LQASTTETVPAPRFGRAPEATELFIPANDCADPEVSLVVPALNEEITIGTFVDWCLEGLAKAGVKGEVLIVDSSKDRTPEIALAHGARVLRTPKRGLGRAYIDAFPFIRGKYVIMGDCDCTYDFRDIVPFLEAFRRGAEFVMGSRFKGTIDPGAMPPLHQYFGTPLTTWILNIMYGCKFSDIHCGMRGLTREAYYKLGLQSQKWEYASEMIIKAVKLGLRTEEVPIHFLKDMEGRRSHLKTTWYAPWVAGWQNLRVFFLFRPDFFLRQPGRVLFALGALLVFGLAFGPAQLGPIKLALYSQVLGLFMLALGTSFVGLDALTTLYLKFDKQRCRRLWRFYDYDVIAPLSALAIVAGGGISLSFVVDWVRSGFKIGHLSHGFVTGLGFMLLGAQLFLYTLIVTLFNFGKSPDDVDATGHASTSASR
jgi:glycosyltransferase involved in cell wall biosynthesis